MEIPEYDQDPEVDKLLDELNNLIMSRYRQAVAAAAAAAENQRVREGVHALFLIAAAGTMHELRCAMAVAFPPSRSKY
jgi:hypothetical protein